MNDIVKKLLLSVMAVLLSLGAIVSPANASPLRCYPPATLYEATVFPGSEESLPGTTIEWQVSVYEGIGEYRYSQGYDFDTVGEVGSITREGPHRLTYNDLTKVDVLNVGDLPLEVKACYVLVE
ncbi:MAG: hypothetical protein J7647_15765 [Cyanobacteria bacterium SBLK]|nr:hypothetical protein [Cyanobacteria bacterium SBLK]